MSNDHLFLARLDRLTDVLEELVGLAKGAILCATNDPDSVFASPLLDRMVVAEEQNRLLIQHAILRLDGLETRLGVIADRIGP